MTERAASGDPRRSGSGLYVRESKKTVDEAQRDLEEAVKRHGFGVLHAYDFRRTLREKGQTLEHECRVLEVCNPKQASEVLRRDMSVNMALPCRLSVYEDGGRTKLGMISPGMLLGLVSSSPELAAQAAEVDALLRRMIDEAL